MNWRGMTWTVTLDRAPPSYTSENERRGSREPRVVSGSWQDLRFQIKVSMAEVIVLELRKHLPRIAGALPATTSVPTKNLMGAGNGVNGRNSQ